MERSMKIQTLKPVPWVKLSTCRERTKAKISACSYGASSVFLVLRLRGSMLDTGGRLDLVPQQ